MNGTNRRVCSYLILIIIVVTHLTLKEAFPYFFKKMKTIV